MDFEAEHFVHKPQRRRTWCGAFVDQKNAGGD